MNLFIGIQTILSGFRIGAASGWDIFIILIFLIVTLIYGFFLGRNRIIALLISTYFSLAILMAMPWQALSSFKWLGVGKPSSSLQIFLFLALIILFFFLIPRSVLSSAMRLRKRGDASWLQLFLLAVVQIGLLATVIFSLLPKESVYNLAPLLKKIFIGPESEFVWITLPILVILLMRRKKKVED